MVTWSDLARRMLFSLFNQQLLVNLATSREWNHVETSMNQCLTFPSSVGKSAIFPPTPASSLCKTIPSCSLKSLCDVAAAKPSTEFPPPTFIVNPRGYQILQWGFFFPDTCSVFSISHFHPALPWTMLKQLLFPFGFSLSYPTPPTSRESPFPTELSMERRMWHLKDTLW